MKATGGEKHLTNPELDGLRLRPQARVTWARGRPSPLHSLMWQDGLALRGAPTLSACRRKAVASLTASKAEKVHSAQSAERIVGKLVL